MNNVNLTALTLDDCRLLITLIDNHSVSIAAESLGISQSSASRRLNKIQELLGIALFVRQAHGTKPTEDLLQRKTSIQGIITAYEALEAHSKPSPAIAPTHEHFVIAIADSLRDLISPGIFAHLLSESDSLHVTMKSLAENLSSTERKEVVEHLSARRWHCVIHLDRELALTGNLNTQEFNLGDYVIVQSVSRHLVEETSIKEVDFLARTQVCSQPSSLTGYFSRRKLQRTLPIKTSSYRDTLQTCERANVSGLVPRVFCQAFISQQEPKVQVHQADFEIPLPKLFAYLSVSEENTETQWLARVIGRQLDRLKTESSPTTS